MQVAKSKYLAEEIPSNKKAFHPEPMEMGYPRDMEQRVLVALGLLSLCAAAYIMLHYLDHQQYPGPYSHHNFRSDLGDSGIQSVPKALSKLFSKYG